MDNIWSAQFTKPDPGKTGGLVGGILVGAVVVALAAILVAYTNALKF